MKNKLPIYSVALGMLLTAANSFAGAGITTVYNTSAEELWKAVDFHQPSENIMPPIVSSTRQGEGMGAKKVNMLNGGGEVHLQLVYFSEQDKAFNYIIQSSPLPVSNYVGEVRVTSLDDNKAQLSWRGVFEPVGVTQADADAALQGFYGAISGRIGELFPAE